MNRTIAMTLFASALFANGCLLQPDARDCRRERTCATCLQQLGCGWCPSVGCVRGSPSGPEDTLFCEENYQWNACAPLEDPCDVLRDVGSCEPNEGCEWCFERNLCSAYGRRCPSVMDCEEFTDIAQCHRMGCGWCRTGRVEGGCMAVASECTGRWSRSSDPSCSHADCVSCTADPYCEYQDNLGGTRNFIDPDTCTSAVPPASTWDGRCWVIPR